MAKQECNPLDEQVTVQMVFLRPVIEKMGAYLTLSILLLLVVAANGMHSANANEAPKRVAIITDTAGVSSEVTDLRFSESGKELSHFYNSYGNVAVVTEKFQIAIPLNDLISIKIKDAKNKIVEVTYQWLEKEKRITGILVSGKFTGKSDFGDVEVSTINLKELVFTDLPSPMTAEQKKELKERLNTFKATLLLKDETRVSVADLRRHDSYYSTEGYLIGGSTRYRHYTDFRFKRGESLLTVSFTKIKRIEFANKDSVVVTLKNGKSTTGTLSKEDGAEVEGFTGLNESGNFFISSKHVKAVVFGSANQSK